ncbi:hypothetical protein MCUN1_000992 [Malassezia cuniculi]|uniref:Major facilitator superfamily (MFS) profile domain-containing protein n=1 Tax=Malassezia cuniculi TaxID=948313 RepID=A0AAF0JAC0_9BASI|nr:hypothetical protein MCUN1_000992 [Malassezia cuniculi]
MGMSAADAKVLPLGDAYADVSGTDADPEKVVSRDTEAAPTGKPEIGVAELALEVEPDEKEQRRVLFKIDLLFLPLASLCVLFQMLDKTLLNYANLMGVKDDANLSGSEYSWLVTIFFLGYMIGTPMHAWFLQHVTLSRYVSGVMTVWGIVLMCHAACASFSAFMAVRFFLGFFEAAISPALVLLTGRFYKRNEQVVRVLVWYSMNAWAMLVGGLMSFGILSNPPTHLHMWQEMFIAIGACTIAFGVTNMFIMPSSPDTTWYLTERERAVAVYRIASNQSGIHDTRFKWYQVREASLDVRLYLFFFAFATANVVNSGINNFASEIIAEFTSDRKRNALYGMCYGSAQVIAMFMGGSLFLWLKRRDAPSIFGYVVAIAGIAMMTWIDPVYREARLAGLCMAFFFPLSFPMLYSWQSNGVSGTTKRIIFNASLQIAYCVGNAAGPQAFAERDKEGGYVPAKIDMLVMLAVSGVLIACVSITHWRWNQRRADNPPAYDEAEALRIALSDLTDKERPDYKYPY